MKRQLRLPLISTVLLLAACGTGKTQTETTTSTTASTTSTTTTTTSTTVTETTTVAKETKEATSLKTTDPPTTVEAIAPEPTTEVTTMYNQTTTRRQSSGAYQAVFDDIADLDGKSDNEVFDVDLRIEFNRYIAKYIARDMEHTQYAFYDLNGDGVDEMFVGSYGDFYTIYYLNNGVPARLAQNFVPDFGHERNFSTVYQDGRVLENNWNSGSGDGRATVLQLSGQTLYEVDAVEYQALQFDESDLGLEGVAKVDIASLPWQSF